MSDPGASPELDPERFRALRIERDGDLLRVEIAHPTSPLNAVDDLLHGELAALFRGLRRESAARAVLLTGRGRAFSAGGDVVGMVSIGDVNVHRHAQCELALHHMEQ